MSLWDDPFTIRSGQISTGLRRRVYKMRGELFHAGPALKPWMVTGHPLGAKSFTTWDEAMAYANTRVTMWNTNTRKARCPNEGRPCFCTGACQRDETYAESWTA